MRSIFKAILVFSLVLSFSSTAFAQEADPMTKGILAFRSGEYAQAVTHFEKALKDDASNAEAHFLLARLFWETDLKDAKRAGLELDKALLLDPENVQFMVARLQQLREDSKFFMIEMTRERQRREMSARILKLDPTNSFAHEELGKSYIRDFWRYRNAMMYPTLTFNEYKYRGSSEPDPMATRLLDDLREYEQQNGLEESEQLSEQIGRVEQNLDPSSIFMADEFDVEALKRQGFPVVDMSGRALLAYNLAIEHLNAALDSDPRQRSVYDDLMEIYALKGEYDEALKMLSQMYVFFPEDVKLWTYLGYAHYHAGNMEAASKSFETSFKYMDQNTVYAYTHLEDILPEDEQKLYKMDPAAYSARFWTSKDPRYLTPYNERKMEHYARLTYADLIYGAPKMDLRGWNTERGQILVRYGVPQGDVVIIPRSGSGVRNATQANDGNTASQTIQVARSGSDHDMLEEANTYNIWDYGEFKFVFEDPFRNGEYRLYAPSSADLAAGGLPWVNDYTIKAKETFRKTPERYIYEAPGRQIELPFVVATFKGKEGNSDVYVNYAIPITQAYDPSKEFINITANAGTFVVAENRDMLVERRRTIYGLPTSQVVRFDESNLWVDTQLMTTPPGQHEVSVEFETAGGSTVAVQRRKVDVHNFSGSSLAMSDILLAYRIEETDNGKPIVPTDIFRDNLSIQPAPWTVFSIDQPIYIYFEVYNLTLGDDSQARYEVEATLTPKDKGSGVGRILRGLFGGNKGGVSTGVPIAVSSSFDGQYLILDALNQETGLFTLNVKITDTVAGKSVQMDKELFLE